MKENEQQLKQYLQKHNIQADHLSFQQSCHSVQDAAKAVNTSPTDFVKNICLIDENNNLIVAIVKGEDRASTTNVGKVLRINRPRIATPQEIIDSTGYPCGGTPSFGYNAIFLIDKKVMEKEIVFSGGGSETSLIKISTKELQKANNAKVVSIRK